MKTFKANKGIFWIYILIAFLFPSMICLFFKQDDEVPILILLSLFIPFFLFVWIYFSTNYKTDQTYLYYQSGFLKGKIEIQKIKEIQVNKTLWVGVKPAMATKGLIIIFGFDQVYIAPKSKENLLQTLLQINPNITLK